MSYGVSGTEIRAAVRKASAWSVPVACGAGDGILVGPSRIRREATIETDDSLGNFFSGDGEPGAIKVEGDIPMYLRYDGLDLLLAQAMGTAGAPVGQGVDGVYAYTYRLVPDTDGSFVTFARHMKNYVEEIPSMKITGFTLKGELGGPVEMTLRIIGIDKVFDSSVNTLTSFEGVTWRETGNRVRFSEGAFRMNARTGPALAEEDRIYPSGFELSVRRRLKGEYTGQYRHVSGTNVQDLIDEPTNDGPPEITLAIRFPRHRGTANLAILSGDTRQKMDITFTGKALSPGVPRTFTLLLPHLQLKSVDIADERGIIQEPLEFLVHASSGEPAGMSGIAEPLRIAGINQRSTDPLA